MSRDADPNIPPEVRSALDGDEDISVSEIEAAWRLLGRAAPSASDPPAADETWSNIEAHLAETDSTDQTPDRSPAPDRPARDRSPARSTGTRTTLRWGGVAVVVAAMAFALWLWTQPVVIETAPGESVTQTLPDGSTVELHGDTRLSYTRSFSTIELVEAAERTVQLQGEAYFEVAPASRAFRVETPTAHVEVVSTAFAVRSRAQEASDTHVALVEGQLLVSPPEEAGAAIRLDAGEAVQRGPDGQLRAVRDTSVDRMTAWRRGGFAVTDHTLPEITRELERRFGKTLQIDPSISRATRSSRLTLYYSESVSLETILHDVCMARGLSYRPTSTGFVLSATDDSSSS